MLRILLADDHAVFRAGLRALLEAQGRFQVVGEAGDGPATVALTKRTKFDVLVLDVSMPGSKGAEVTRSVLQAKPEAAIVMLTMHEDEYYVRKLLKAGAKGFVLKKSAGTDLIKAIDAVHQGNKYVDPALASVLMSNLADEGGAVRPAQRPSGLSAREREVCGLLAAGYTNVEVAEMLGLSDRTVETHRQNIMEKLAFKTRAQLVRYAIQEDLLRTE